MGPKKDPTKPKGKMNSYACFVQLCRDEHRKKFPNESIQFKEFSQKCAEKWKSMSPKEKKRFEDLADKDKARYERDMAHWSPGPGQKAMKRKKDPNAPKRALSAFFFFCNEHRPAIRAEHPEWGIGDVAKKLGHMWETVQDKPKFEKLAQKDRDRYEKEMKVYRGDTGGVAAHSDSD